MNIRFALGLGCILAGFTGYAAGQTETAKTEQLTPLRQVVNLMMESVPVSEKTLSIKGIEWSKYGIVRRPSSPHFYRIGYIYIRRLGKSEIIVSGKDNEITKIDTSYYEPNKRVKAILQQNLGSRVDIRELEKECEIIFSDKMQKIYRIDLENRKTVYVLSDVNTSFEPYMSRLRTDFSFHKEMPEYWGCK